MLIGVVAGGGRHPGRDEVGLALEAQKRRQGCKALTYLAAEQQPRIWLQRPREQQPRLWQIGRCHQTFQGTVNGHAPGTAVVGIDVQLPLGVVELPHLGGGNHIGRLGRAEIQAGPSHRQSLAHGGVRQAQLGDALHPAAPPQVLDEIQRQPVGTEGIHGTDCEAVAMGENQMAVQPGAGVLR